MKSYKKQTSLLIGLLGLLITAIALMGCKSKIEDPLPSGTSTKVTDQSNSATQEEEEVWVMDLPESAFDEAVEVQVVIMDDEASNAYENADFTWYGPPMKVECEGRTNVRLNEPATFKVNIPDEYWQATQAGELFFAYYYDGSWEYYLPKEIQLKDQTATFDAYHFSVLGFGRPSEKEQIDTFASCMATLKWSQEDRAIALSQSINKDLDGMLTDLGVKDSTVRNQLMADVLSYLEHATIDSGGVSPIDALAQMANAASKGSAGKQDYTNKLLEFTGKALASSLENIKNAPSKYVDKFATGANVIGNMSSALGYLSEGDTQGAAEAISNMLKNTNPVVALVDSTLGYIKKSAENTINYWTQAELEKAYQIYTTGVGGKYGYEDGLKGDFDTIFTLLGGGDRQISLKILKQHCQRLGIDESTLSQDEKNQIVAKAKAALKTNFDNRIISETEIDQLKVKEAAFITALKQEGLLNALDYRIFFGIDNTYDIGDRLEKLYRARELVLSHIDDDIAKNLSDDDMAKIIKQWIYWNEKKDRTGYFTYLKDMGYLSEPLSLDGVSEDLAWVLLDTVPYDAKDRVELQNNNNTSYNWENTYSENSVTGKMTYIGKTDTTTKINGYYPTNGESVTINAGWSTPQSIISKDGLVTMTLQLSGEPTSGWPNANGMIHVQIVAVEEDGSVPGQELGTLKNDQNINFFETAGTNNYQSFSETVSGSLGAATQKGSKIAVRVSAGLNTIATHTTYIYECKPLD